jgi:hypothetical protein
LCGVFVYGCSRGRGEALLVDFRHEGRPSAYYNITTGFFRSKVDFTQVSQLPQQEQVAASVYGLVIRIFKQGVVKRLGLFELREIERRQGAAAVFVPVSQAR